MSLGVARVAAVALSAATAKTVVQIVPASNRPVRIVELGVSFDSTAATDAPVAVDLLRQSTAGTSSALTVVSDREDDASTLQMTALQSFTVEPTAGNLLRTWHVTPVGGLLIVQFPLGREPLALTSRIAIRCNAPQTQTVTAYLVGEE